MARTPMQKGPTSLQDPLARVLTHADARAFAEQFLGEVETTPPQKSAGDQERGKTASPTLTDSANAAERWLHAKWWSQRQRVIAAMELAGISDTIIQRAKECGKFARVQRCQETNELRIRGSKCRNRFCRRCAEAHALLVADNLAALIKTASLRVSHIVLTLKHQQLPLLNMRKRLYQCFAKLRRNKTWQRHVKGGAAFCQMHLSEHDQAWHVHFHVIAEHHYIEQAELSALWENVTGDSRNVWIERVRNTRDAAREAARYVAAPVDKKTSESVAHLAEAIDALKAARLCFTFGSWKGNALTDRQPEDPNKTWDDIDLLGDVICQARAGNEQSKALLAELFPDDHRERAPPTLFHRRLYLTTAAHNPWRCQEDNTN